MIQCTIGSNSFAHYIPNSGVVFEVQSLKTEDRNSKKCNWEDLMSAWNDLWKTGILD